MNRGYVKLFRKLDEWEWYKDHCTKELFIHCLIKANHIEKHWRGIVIPRGSFISSVSKLSEELDFSVQQIRTAIKHLNSTNELTSSSTAKYTLFTVLNYDKYQQDNKVTNKQLTNNQQTANKQLTTTNNNKHYKALKRMKEEREGTLSPFGKFENVMLAENELQDLKNQYQDYQKKIDYLSSYKTAYGKEYANDYAIIIMWALQDEKGSLIPECMNDDQSNEEVEIDLDELDRLRSELSNSKGE